MTRPPALKTMLFVDSDLISLAELQKIDWEVSAVAAKSSITVDGSGGICELVWSECQQTLLAAMQSYTSYPAQTGMPATHIAAVTNVGIPSRTQPRVRLNQIVASDSNYSVSRSPLQAWITYYALALFYRDASTRLVKDQDRFALKWERYEKEAACRWRTLRNNGLPMVYQPMEAPGAKHGFNAGSWSPTNLSGAAGGSNSLAQNILVAITWYDGSKYTSRVTPPASDTDPAHNAESGPSTLIPFTIPVNDLLKVDITSLTPPNGIAPPVGLSQGTFSPLNATHWNIYAGAVPATNDPPILYLQKEGVPVATKTWTLATDPTTTGPLLTSGQYADLNLVFLNIAMRA